MWKKYSLFCCGLLLLAACTPEPATDPDVPPPTSTSDDDSTPEAGTDGASATTPAAAPEPRDTPLAVGDPAPDFQLPDQQGQLQSLSDLRNQGKVALVFYRSADW